MRIPSIALMASLVMALTLSACSPTQNWRDIALEGTALKAQLPCKPDRTTRSVSTTEAGARLLDTLGPRLAEIEDGLAALARLAWPSAL